MNNEKCLSIVERDKKVIAECQHLSYYPLAIAKCDNATITDADGNEYIDFLSSASSLNMGSSNPIVVEAIKEQLAREGSSYVSLYQNAVRLVKEGVTTLEEVSRVVNEES